MQHLTESIGFLSGKLSQASEQALANKIQPFAITTRQLGLLFFVSDHPGMSQKDIGERIRVDRTTMVAHVDHLEEEGLLQRIRNERDRRIAGLYLTEKGETVLQKGWALLQETEHELLHALSENEQEVLRNLLRKWWQVYIKGGHHI